MIRITQLTLLRLQCEKNIVKVCFGLEQGTGLSVAYPHRQIQILIHIHVAIKKAQLN